MSEPIFKLSRSIKAATPRGVPRDWVQDDRSSWFLSALLAFYLVTLNISSNSFVPFDERQYDMAGADSFARTVKLVLLAACGVFLLLRSNFSVELLRWLY